MSYIDYPLSSDDLRAIADQVDGLNSALIGEDGEYKSFTGILPDRIQFAVPDDPKRIIGHLVFEEGWIGIDLGGLA